jgi:hypothetical protein
VRDDRRALTVIEYPTCVAQSACGTHLATAEAAK